MANRSSRAEPVLYVFSGLPGSGKSTLSQPFAQRLGANQLRVDTIEQAIRAGYAADVDTVGYDIAYRTAADNLRLGQSVAADAGDLVVASRTLGKRRQRIPERNIATSKSCVPTWTCVDAASRRAAPP